MTLREEFDKLCDDQYNVSWNDKVEIIYLKDYIDFLEQKIEALSQHDVIKSVCDHHHQKWEGKRRMCQICREDRTGQNGL
jgi:hypothetical protein